MLVLILPIIAAVLVLCTIILLARRLSAAPGTLPVDAAWIDEMSADRYKPMMRLLDERDFEFLRSQPGFNPKLASRLRAQRCRIFSGYLRCLESDFRRVCLAAKLLLLQSHDDRPDLAATLFRSQVRFLVALFVVNVHVFFYRWGIGRVDVSALIGTFDSVRSELRGLAPSVAGALV